MGRFQPKVSVIDQTIADGWCHNTPYQGQAPLSAVKMPGKNQIGTESGQPEKVIRCVRQHNMLFYRRRNLPLICPWSNIRVVQPMNHQAIIIRDGNPPARLIWKYNTGGFQGIADTLWMTPVIVIPETGEDAQRYF